MVTVSYQVTRVSVRAGYLYKDHWYVDTLISGQGVLQAGYIAENTTTSFTQMILFRKYKYKWCNKNELKIYYVELNLRGDFIRAIKMPLSCSHPLFT